MWSFISGKGPRTIMCYARLRWLTFATLALSLVLSGCKKKSAPSASETIPTISSGATVAPKATLSSHAARFGFLSHVPANTQIYLGTLNVKKHLQALATSSFYSEVSAYLDDKTPAPTSDGTGSPQKMMAPLLSDSTFLSVGSGGAEAVAVLSRIAELNSRSFYGHMAGLLNPSSAAAPPVAAKSGATDVVTQIEVMVKDLTLPDLLVGIRGDNPQESLKALVSESQAKWWAQLGKKSEVTLADKSHFVLHEGVLGTLLTSYEKNLSERPDGPDKKLLLAVIGQLKTKPVAVAWGTMGDHALLSISAKRPNFQFPATAEKSLLGKPEWDALVPHATNSMIAVGWMDSTVLQAAHTNNWLVPALRAALTAAGKGSPLEGLGKALEKQLGGLEESEQRFLTLTPTNAIFASWWDNGLRAELHGGISEDDVAPPTFLRYAGLLSTPSLLFGHTGVTNETSNARLNDYLEHWGAIVRDAGWAILERGKATGSPLATIRPWLEQEVLPPLMQLYQAGQKMTETGLGPERAVLVEVSAPATPANDAKADKASTFPIPRIARLAPVTDRRAIAKGWLNMEPAVGDLKKALPMLQPSLQSDPVPTQEAGMDIYSIPLPIPWAEVTPCVGVSEEDFLFSTSQDQGKALAGRLLKDSAASERLVSRWRLNVPLLLKLLTHDVPAEPVETLGSYLRWMQPLGPLTGSTTVSHGRVVRDWSWDIRDPTHFD